MQSLRVQAKLRRVKHHTFFDFFCDIFFDIFLKFFWKFFWNFFEFFFFEIFFTHYVVLNSKCFRFYLRIVYP